eukprot:2721461-Amphidinium_carterae.1
MVKEAHGSHNPHRTHPISRAIGYSGQPPYTGQPPYNAKNGKGYGKPPQQQWNNFGKGKKGQVVNIADDPNAYSEQQWHPDCAWQDQSYTW